jgi:hypothetical protein
MKRFLACLFALILACPAGAVVISASPVTSTGVNLQTAQTGTGDSTNTIDRGYTLGGPCLLRIVSTIGATPTVTVNIQGSMDGTTFYNVPYSLPATPDTWTVAALTITTATTGNYIMRPATPWRFLKLVLSANTNVTLTSDVFAGWP